MANSEAQILRKKGHISTLNSNQSDIWLVFPSLNMEFLQILAQYLSLGLVISSVFIDLKFRYIDKRNIKIFAK